MMKCCKINPATDFGFCKKAQNAINLKVQNAQVMKEQIQRHAASNPVYGMGFIGALVYYIAHATSFWMGALGILKAIFWPAFLVYEALKALGM